MTNLFLTGPTGFIGSALLQQLIQHKNYIPTAAVRNSSKKIPSNIQSISVDEINAQTQWQSALENIDVVIHLAARVHIMNEIAADPLTEFRKINVAGTLNLARQAAQAGVKRFIFISSIKVNGESTQIEKPFTADDIPAPEDAYGMSKYEAELGLQEIAKNTGIEIVIIRLPLIYGPGVKANFLAMMRWLQKGVPLPLGAVQNNRRSLLALDNLIDLIITCIEHPAAANQTFLASDGEDLSTTDLLKRMAFALEKKPYLLPVPVSLLKLAGKLTGKTDIISRLCGSLQVDISKTCSILNWTPPISVDEGLRRVAEPFLRMRKK